MTKKRPDQEADFQAVSDRGESVTLMEPMLLSSDSRFRPEIADLALELAAKSASLHSRLPKGIVAALAELVRTMNCYYSNLIEGHNTHPIEIEKALRSDFSNDKKKRESVFAENGFLKFTNVSATVFPTTSFGLSLRTPRTAFLWYPDA